MRVNGQIVKISTHALREEGDLKKERAAREHLISTHALREEGDKRYFGKEVKKD